METKYQIIPVEGEITHGMVKFRGDEPEYRELRDLIEPILKKDRAAAKLEHVTVLHNDKRTDMFVDEEGVLVGLPVNDRATEIYYAASRAAGREITPNSPKIHGVAILFDDRVWF